MLRTGYVRTEVDGSSRAAGTVSLVLAEEVRMIVDTGGPAEQRAIVAALAERGLAPEQINYVVCTHGHTDHIGNNNLFPGATFLVAGDRSVADRFTPLDLSRGRLQIALDIEIVATPGHTSEDISVLVRTDRGVVAIVGDLFESGTDWQEDVWVRCSRDPVRQRESREMILAAADVIVPGHGGPFDATGMAGPERVPRAPRTMDAD